MKVLAVAGLLASAACDSDTSLPPMPLCDPMDATAGLVAAMSKPPAGRLGGAAVIYDNGAYLFVDARCNYWVNNPSQIWAEARTGVLDADSARQYGERLHFNAWHELSGAWSDSRGGVFDAPLYIFDHANHAVLCVDLCGSADVPVTVRAMRDALPTVAEELWDRGTPVVSGIRAIAVAAYPGPGIPFMDWPLMRPIADFVRTGNIGFGQGTLEDDMASAQVLKELRASFLRGDHGAFTWNMLPVKADGAYYGLHLRDTLPFEDERGIVPLSVDADSP